MNVHESDILIMVIPRKNQVFPIAGVALNASQGSKKCLSETLGAIIVTRSGDSGIIKSINRKGLYGQSLLEKLKSALFGVYHIELCLEETELSYEDIKGIIVKAIVDDTASASPSFWLGDRVNDILEALHKAVTMEEVFSILEINDVTECLDML